MEVKKIEILNKSDTNTIFSITYKTWYGALKTRKAYRVRNLGFCRWLDNDGIIFNTGGICAILDNNIETFEL